MIINVIKAANLMAIVMITSISIFFAFVLEQEQKRKDLIQQEQIVHK